MDFDASVLASAEFAPAGQQTLTQLRAPWTEQGHAILEDRVRLASQRDAAKAGHQRPLARTFDSGLQTATGTILRQDFAPIRLPHLPQACPVLVSERPKQ